MERLAPPQLFRRVVPAHDGLVPSDAFFFRREAGRSVGEESAVTAAGGEGFGVCSDGPGAEEVAEVGEGVADSCLGFRYELARFARGKSGGEGSLRTISQSRMPITLGSVG